MALLSKKASARTVASLERFQPILVSAKTSDVRSSNASGWSGRFRLVKERRMHDVRCLTYIIEMVDDRINEGELQLARERQRLHA